jgi:predicted RNase H-like HicB family nuclease
MAKLQTEVRPQRWSVEVTRSGGWWAIRVPDLPGVFSQCRRLDQIDEHVCEAIALMLDADDSEVATIDVTVVSPPEIAELVQTVAQAEHTARDAVEAAASARREAAQTLLDQGYPMRDIGRLIGISHQRVSQILNEAS